MREKFHIIYFTIIFSIFILIIFSAISTPIVSEDFNTSLIEPFCITQAGEYEKELLFDVSDMDLYKKDIAFFSKHQYIKVYSDNNLIYKYDESGGIWGRTNGASWNFIDIPYGTSTLKIHLTAVYDNVKNDVPTFIIGDKLGIFQNIYKKSIPSLLISLLIIIFGIALIIYWLFLFRRFKIGQSMLYLGMFSFLIGLYLINETEAAIIGIHHRITCIWITYLTLMTLGPTCIIFMKEFIGTVENVIWKILCTLSLIEFVVCLTLQFLNIYDLRETLFLTHILIALSIIYLVFTLIVKIYRHEYSIMLKSSLIGFFILACSTLFNLATYYKDTSVSDTGIVGRLGFLAFISILSKESIKHSLELMEEGRNAEMYKKLAIKDMLTGLNNRNAYISDIDTLTAYDDIMIITFDLNNLKKCNDNLGHAEGDFYILSAANIINEVFSRYGTCYRIGGDEFCVMIKNASKCPVSQLADLLETKEQEFNNNSPTVNMHISYGYAVFNSKTDSDLEQTRNRADALMYDNKRKSKQTINEQSHT